jgi:alpha-1,2-mannosyltransferase
MTSLAEAPADEVVAQRVRSRVPAWPTIRLAVGVAVVGFLVRLVPILIGGGLHFFGRYDDGVYYTAAEALTFGHVPYRDFVLLHPPGLTLVLVPFAALGRLTSDPTGMAVGRLVFMAIGALNAVLIALLAKRWGWLAAITAGLLYACWMPAVFGEQSTLLEPLGTTGVLTALLLLCRPGLPIVRRRAEVFAGVALGLAVTFKIWYVAPVAVVLAWLLLRRRFRSTARVLAASAVSAAVVLLPFFVLAPRQMFRMVVLDQLERSGQTTSPFVRLPFILGVQPLANGHSTEIVIGTSIAVAVIAVAALVCLRDAAARVIVALLTVNLLILLVTPAFFLHYAELTAAPMTLIVGIGLSKLRGAITRAWVARAVIACFGAAILTSGIAIMATPEGTAFPGKSFAAAAPPGCVMADDPQAMIQMNRLTSDFKAGCVVPVDVSGITYDRLRRVGPPGTHLGRAANLAWQQYLHDYLFSGTSFVVLRAPADALARPFRGMIYRSPVLARDGHLVLRGGLDTGPAEVSGVKAAPVPR